MQVRTAFHALCLTALLIPHVTAHAQLPDLRGRVFYFTGTLDVNGVAFGTNFGALAPGGITIARSNLARLIIDPTGPEDNSSLTGGLKLPLFADSAATCVNPTIPLSGSFNRTTGQLTLSGTIPGTATLDFGVTTVPGLGLQRIQVRFNNLSVTLTGTGSVDAQGNLTIRNPGSNPLSFTTGPNTPRLALGPRESCAFGLMQDNVSDALLSFRNWTASQATISGTVTLEACSNAAQPLRITLCPQDGGNTFQLTVTPDANGNYVARNVNPGLHRVGLKAGKWLQKFVPNVNLTVNNTATGINATLLAGDANDDNAVDVFDLAVLIDSFDSAEGDPNWNDGAADFNCDGAVDVLDLALLIQNFDQAGEECP
ncbi:MAG: dockerin type I domain-containing protein [Chloroherpetonaceae bacterium]|nr:dockerin type I domain-containing protein [Chthonomonadaceae bacterium]MDW8206772.1 dockerin type I domain-containing protein [Chloroherpetonaceae bacterium]